MRGCSPACAVMSIRSMQARGAGDQRADAAARGAPASVKTVRLWTASVWRSSSVGAGCEGGRRSRRSPPRRGPRRSSGRRAAAPRPRSQPTSSSPSRTIGSPSIVRRRARARRSRGGPGTWTVPPIAAEAPKATWAGAEDLLVLEHVAGQLRLLVGADPELGDVGAVLAVRRAAAPAARALARRSPPTRWPPSTVSSTGSRDPADRRRSCRRRPACPRRVPSIGAMNPSPQGRLPNAPRRGQLAGVGDRRRGRRGRAAGRCRWRR